MLQQGAWRAIVLRQVGLVDEWVFTAAVRRLALCLITDFTHLIDAFGYSFHLLDARFGLESIYKLLVSSTKNFESLLGLALWQAQRGSRHENTLAGAGKQFATVVLAGSGFSDCLLWGRREKPRSEVSVISRGEIITRTVRSICFLS